MKPHWLTIHELASALKLSERTVRRAYLSGEIPVERLFKSVRFDLIQVKEAMRKNAEELGPTGRVSSVEGRRAPGGDSRPRAEQPHRPRLVKRGRNFQADTGRRP